MNKREAEIQAWRNANVKPPTDEQLIPKTCRCGKTGTIKQAPITDPTGNFAYFRCWQCGRVGLVSRVTGIQDWYTREK